MASYKNLIEWIAENDEWTLVDCAGNPIISVCMVADVCNKEIEQVVKDIERKRKKNQK